MVHVGPGVGPPGIGFLARVGGMEVGKAWESLYYWSIPPKAKESTVGLRPSVLRRSFVKVGCDRSWYIKL